MSGKRAVVIGAGPAGIRASEALVRRGIRPILIDEAPKGGGQIYRQTPVSLRGSAASRYGFEARKAVALHRTLVGLRERIDYRPGTLAWNIWQREIHTLGSQSVDRIPFDFLVIAAGATDRILPIPGWTLPGVYSLGGAQIALKYQACAIGRRTVLVGTGPLLYLVAYQYAKAGATVAGVLETNRPAARRQALPKLLAGRSMLVKGLYYYGWLRARGISIEEGALPLRFTGNDRVEAVTYQYRDRARTLSCDAVGLGFGLRSETQLADLAGCRFRFDIESRQWVAERDDEGESTVPGIFLAGDGATIGGADAAELWGERIGLVIAARCGSASERRRLAVIDCDLARLARFRAGLEQAFPFPVGLLRAIEDETVLCRCEAIRVGEARAAIRVGDIAELNRLKAITRVGMGRCQGRFCGTAAAEILSAMTGRDLASVGRLRAQPPVKPIPLPWSAAS